ncbi:DNA cytosine methyltransferase (plasmid) [Pontibacillus sp. ALD_SL1]|uniref:DNA cytosine methyltransferase n=1 Tax=Pontibacillus sp. ALD_SL1 TaxID=2777185 RepID=UPI001A970855|nr:DNA cytosine methyltransferase [Pontibacillus sp. ALD_SL1]QST02261.1 DNA cytosine methyltransferase [Pontibacillus sp. ALD_SL1]
MKNAIKKRLYKIKNRLYIEAKYLAHYGFGIGQSYKYSVDPVRKNITIVPTEHDGTRRVAKTTQKTGKTVPVIDIKTSDIQSFFEGHSEFEVEIKRGSIVFSVKQPQASVISLEEAREQKTYKVSVQELAKVSNFEQMTIFDLFKGDGRGELKKKAIGMLSLFSGCGSLDKGFKDEGYDIRFANDRYEKKALKDYHIETYKQNIGDHIIMRDVLDFQASDIPQVDFVTAGIPCVKFSALNTKDNFRDGDSPFHPMVEQTINIIKWSNARSFLIENVANFITVKGGAILKRFKERLSEFNIVSSVIDATSLGSPQKRRRSFILGMKDAIPSITLPNLTEVNTVRDAFYGTAGVNGQDLYFKPTEKTLSRMIHVPQGGNIQSVPVELRAKKKRFNNYCQRLKWDDFAPTITHVQDDVFIHPEEHRYLSVRETARLFSLPDDFTFTGSLTSIFEMLKNAVDYRVSRFLAKTIKEQLNAIKLP